MLLLALALPYSCAKEDVDVLEDAAVKETTKEVTAKAACDTCNQKPSSLHPPINNMIIENRGSGATLNGETSANNHCNTNYFNTCWGYMVLKSPGASGSRTELKFGSNKEVSLNDYSALRFTMILENVPKSSSSQNKGVTIGQIHNRHASNITNSRPLLRVDATTQRNKVRVTFAHTYNKGGSDESHDLIDFKDGERIYIELKVLSSGNKVEVFAKNDTRPWLTRRMTFTVKNNWLNSNVRSGFYYKTGVYQQLGGAAPRASYNYFKADSI